MKHRIEFKCHFYNLATNYCDYMYIYAIVSVFFNKDDMCQPLLDSCISAVVEERLICHTVTYDLGCPSLDLGLAVLAWPDNDGASGRHGRVFIEEVERPEKEAHGISRSCSVGDVL